MSADRWLSVTVRCVLLAVACGLVVACSSGSEAGKGAKEGAGVGAVAGAVGSMATALVFGGNVAEAGARGAVAGGASGAVVGGMSGSQRDKQIEEQKEQAAQQAASEQDKLLAELRAKLGDDAYNGMVALANCKYSVAAANADEAMKSSRPEHVLGGLWLSVLAEADQRNESEARALYPQLIERDAKISNEAEAEAAMRRALQQLGDIRAANGLPIVCPA